MPATPGGSSEVADSFPSRLVVDAFFERRRSGKIFVFFRTIMENSVEGIQQQRRLRSGDCGVVSSRLGA
ncbi:hypothetical protein TNCV_4964971 [Trichonephila clavipes]|nr:hypothetical protein TNCV_4964971 [Trichonephila clavipes]